MKKLRIYLYVEDVEWARVDYIHYQEEAESQTCCRLDGFTITHALPVNSGTLIEFKIFYLEELFKEYELELLREVNYIDAKTIELYTELIPDWFFEDQRVIDLFWLDSQGKLPKWRNLPVKEKEAYQTLCLYASGIPTQPIGSGHYVVEGARVKYAIDFYCLLGEAFFGGRGYFGRCDHSLNDCFSEIYRHNPHQPLVEPDTSFTIIQASQIEEVLNNVYPAHFSVILDIFKKYGITVNLS